MDMVTEKAMEKRFQKKSDHFRKPNQPSVLQIT